jgi:signal transduction histidine kinase
LLCLLSCASACALSRDGTIRDLRHTGWGPKEDAPDTIDVIVQTSDGYLWACNSLGLFRFDGLHFEHIVLPRNDRLTSASVFTLFAPKSGGLWIGFSFGGAALLKDGRVTAYNREDGLPPGSVKAFAEDQDGTVWAGTSAGLARLEGSKWRSVGPEYQYSDTQTEALMVDSAGTLWAGSRNKVLSLRKGQKAFEGFPMRVQSNVGFAESPSGAVWMSDSHDLRQIARNENPRRQTASSGRMLVFDRDGSLWTFGPGGGVQRSTDPESLAGHYWLRTNDWPDSYTVQDGLTPGIGRDAVLEDREGNVWASSGVGLDRFSDRNIKPVLGERDESFSPSTGAVAAADSGAVWVGSGRAGSTLSTLQDGRLIGHDEVGRISCATRVDDGTAWFHGRSTLWRFESGRFQRRALPPGTEDNDVQAMVQDRAGRLWISMVGKGAFRMSDGLWSAHGGIISLPKLTAVTLAMDARGRVWFGYTDGRMAVLDGEAVTVFSDETRLSVGNVTAIYVRRQTVWAGGEFGLAALDGTRFRQVAAETAGAFSNITGIVETAAGELWLNTGAGIVRLAAAEVRRAIEDPSYRVHAEIFDAHDGVQGSSARLRPLPTAIEGTDGVLWFVTSMGLYSIDPARIVRNPIPPPVLIQSLAAADKTYAPATDLQLPQRTTSIRIDYVGLSLTMTEKVRYRYKLDGVDNGWQDAQGRQQAFYTNLSPGPHRFHVIAANNDGVWNETGATLNFTIQPTFVQTRAFIALCVTGAGAAVWLLIRMRFRQLATRMRVRFDAQMAERERIARELHDTLLQGMQALILKVHAAAYCLPDSERTRAMLEEALTRADGVLAEGRDRIQDLRIAAETHGDLHSALAAVGEELARGRATTFGGAVEGTIRALNPDVRDEAYRIGREALLNAFAHAQAKSVEMQIIYADEGLRLRIRDDGVGIDAGALADGARPGHWGLQGMRERARKVGGRIDIWSRSQAGTEIELCVPAVAAYRGRSAVPRWSPRQRVAGWRR